MTFTSNEFESLSDILASKMEDWPKLIKQLSESSLSRVEADQMCDALLAEFMSKGINATYEPNEYGLQIESLIDKVNTSIAPPA